MANYYNPYQDLNGNGGYGWKMANFHTHYTVFNDEGHYEDNEGFKQRMAEYAEAGYDIIMHSSQADWYDNSQAAQEVGITSISGQEHVLQYDGVLLVGTKQFFNGDYQDAIDACVEEGGFAIMCHPNQNPELPIRGIRLPFTHELLESLKNTTGIEIFNGCLSRRAWEGVGFGNSTGVDFWDKMLTKGRVLWGFANDDSHNVFEVHIGWTEIYARSTNFSDIKRAVMKGCLCASRGLRLKSFTLEDNTLTMQATYPWHGANELIYRFIGDGGQLLKQENAAIGSYQLTGKGKYVRTEVLSLDGCCLWTQPILNLDFYGKDWHLG